MVAGAGVLAYGLNGAEVKAEMQTESKAIERGDAKFWLETTLRRVYPNSPVGSAEPLKLMAARGERISFQACVRDLRMVPVRVKASISGADGLSAQIRRVGYVPMMHLNSDSPREETDGLGHTPGMVPDPLYPTDTAEVGPEENIAFWINLTVPETSPTGVRTIKVNLTISSEFYFPGWQDIKPVSADMQVLVDVKPLVMKPRKAFPATQWINIESIWDYYKIEPFCERFWELAEAYIANLISHGFNVIYSPIFNARHEIMPRPGQLLKVRRTATDVYEFDFSDVRRWIRIALKQGAEHLEWTHLFTPAPTSAKHPQHVFERWEKIGAMLWPPEILATSDTYRKFLTQLLPAFKKVLEEEKALDISFFHCADEPDGPEQIADYRTARALLKQIAPWMKVLDAMSDTLFAREGLCDMPIPSIATAHIFDQAGCPHWVYFCCGPRGEWLQRLFDTPLPKIRMAGWLFYKLKAKGFLHWGHNYWYKFCTGEILDPFQDGSTGYWPGMPYGDAFVVYPGPNGPIDSIRWEVLAESLQDYALLQSAGINPEAMLLDELKSYAVFPKTEDWLKHARALVYSRETTKS